MLLQWSFTVSRSAVGVVMLDDYSNIWITEVRLKWCVSYFQELISHTILTYVDFPPLGVFIACMKNIVLDPL